MVEIVIAKSDTAEGIYRYIHTTRLNINLVILTNFSNEHNILNILEEEYLHFILHRDLNLEVSKNLHKVLRFVLCKDEEFNYLKLLRFLSKNSNTILRRKNEIDYDNIFWELEDDLF